ncbi:MAG: leucine-rich repeat domain-containing protein [Lachnospiraceae bacterium]|nr:leucine-rich repeat domain-containing protein [Lachnospiraceae bacterium]
MDMAPKEKAVALERAVISCSVEELSKIYGELGDVEMTAPALGIACRFRGLDVVKVLVEKGATFDFPSKRRIEETYNCYIGRHYGNYRTNYSLYLLRLFEDDLKGAFCLKGMTLSPSAEQESGKLLEFLSDDKRIEVLHYLYENREKISFQPEEMLFYAIYFRDTVIVDALKKLDVKLLEVRKHTITDGAAAMDAYWLEYIAMTDQLNDEDYFAVMQQLHAECGGKLFHFTENLYEITKKRFYHVNVFEFFLTHFKPEKMKKYQIIRGLIDIEAVDALEVIEREHWLTMPKKRDEMITYASENGKTVSLAWLLDFKNRTADFAAEQEKAEKKMMRELNAASDSVAALKKIWSYRKREDGTLLITNYKGTDVEVTVPKKIGRGIVTGIGEGAFASDYSNPRATEEQIKQHNRITKVILPETLQYIGKYAFCKCGFLKNITIPIGVTEIDEYAFCKCGFLENITIPGTVKKVGKCAFYHCSRLQKIYICEGVVEIDEYAFSNSSNWRVIRIPQSVQLKKFEIFDYCPKLTIHCPKGSSAEEYCKEKGIRFINSDDSDSIV